MPSALLLAATVGMATIAVGFAGLNCVPLKQAEYCTDYSTGRNLMPKTVCSATTAPVDTAKNWDGGTQAFMANATCPKNPALMNKEIFCQTNFIPCTAGLECPASTKLCYSLCAYGGKTIGHTFLGADVCQPTDATSFCNGRVSAGEVAAPNDLTCVGLSYYNSYYTLAHMAQKPFQPKACAGRFPIFNKAMVDMNSATRIDFMKSLAKKLNRIWGYTDNDVPYKWYRPINIRLRRVQMMKGIVQMFAEVKEFCMIKMRKSTPDYSLKYNQDQYCDKISVTPTRVFANLTKLLDTKKPDRGMVIGEFNVRKGNQPGWPTKCYTWQPEEVPKIPNWVWALTAVASMCCLLSVLILQHRYRNRASYVRLNEKLRSYV